MRIFELEDPQITTRKKDILVSLLNLVRTKAQKRNSKIKMPFSSLQKLMHNVGFDMSFHEFEHLANTDPSIDSFVDEFDDESLVISGTNQPSDDFGDDFGDDSGDDFGGDDFGGAEDFGADTGNDPNAFMGGDQGMQQGMQPGQQPGMQGLPGVATDFNPMQGDQIEPIDTQIVKGMAKRATQRREK